MLKGRINGPVPTVCLSLSEAELDRLREGGVVEALGAKRLGLGDVEIKTFGNGQLPEGITAPE
jgi:hypothetical protein